MNKIFQSMKIAFRALRVNKLRSALTMLGIIIGVGAVIAVGTAGLIAQAPTTTSSSASRMAPTTPPIGR